MNTRPKVKRILCYGDSYTWGYNPGTNHQRFAANKRWTGILQNELVEDFGIIEEGLNSRTLHSDDPRPGKEGRNGKSYLVPCLDTHDPIDIVNIGVDGVHFDEESHKVLGKYISKYLKENYL